MPADNGCERGEEMLTMVRDRVFTEIAVPDTDSPLWPWSYRIGGALSPSPAVELFEAGSLVDVVSSTRLDVPMLRGARAFRVSGSRRVVAWGRLPLTAGVPTVEFSCGRRRALRQAVAALTITTWCWLAVTCGQYDAVTVSHGGMAVRRRFQAGPPCP
jgi:hypothetical protein